MAELNPKSIKDENLQWLLHVDNSSNDKSCGEGVILEGSGEILLEQSLKFDFKTSNNSVDYEAILAGLTMTHDMEARQVLCKNDSQMVVSQVIRKFKVKESLFQNYYHLVRNLIFKFKNVQTGHIQHEHNVRADMLSRLVTTKKKGFTIW